MGGYENTAVCVCITGVKAPVQNVMYLCVFTYMYGFLLILLS